jgi:hypothetical protein
MDKQWIKIVFEMIIVKFFVFLPIKIMNLFVICVILVQNILILLFIIVMEVLFVNIIIKHIIPINSFYFLLH